MSPPPAPAPTATELVTRPDPGLARGQWEAPAWAVWVAFAVVLLGALAYALHRAGVLRRREPPPSLRSRR